MSTNEPTTAHPSVPDVLSKVSPKPGHTWAIAVQPAGAKWSEHRFVPADPDARSAGHLVDSLRHALRCSTPAEAWLALQCLADKHSWSIEPLTFEVKAVSRAELNHIKVYPFSTTPIVYDLCR